MFHVIFIGEVQERHSKYARSGFKSPNLVFRTCFESQQNAQRSKWVVADVDVEWLPPATMPAVLVGVPASLGVAGLHCPLKN